MNIRSLFLKHVAVPSDHGSWVFLLSPLVIGLHLGGRLTIVSVYLLVAALAGFMVRQPVIHAVKIWSGRRPRTELPAALFWTAVFGGIASLHVIGLIIRGYGHLLWLVLPGITVFIWHLELVRRRNERRQVLVAMLATAVLSLTAPAAFWIGTRTADPFGWVLWALVWIQSAASILYVNMRLEQRRQGIVSDLRTRARLGIGPIRFATFNVVAVAVLAMNGTVPGLLMAPYLLQWAETIWGTLRPVTRSRPAAIGIRQLIVSILFTVLFALAF
ncbi:MAG: YwiC-like family protein [Acidobacteria bacterium]|uniref:YwiC-like family protein n=1 Tax=Candidatus Polarisedimenticola svalbardensis TaxID=2886004 RepID=A0A8J7CKF7_9BACT|nr:YwiC-like family protein [Candidatus Polarisedimenticola svalbardensis]